MSNLASKISPQQITKAEALSEELLKKIAANMMAVAEKEGANTKYKSGRVYFIIGLMHQDGNKAAADWYRKAAEQDHVEAQYRLGLLYSQSKVKGKDAKEAVMWCRKAAEQGYANAQYSLGQMYLEGNGVPENVMSGYVWLDIAAASGHRGAKQRIDWFGNRTKNLTPDQIVKAKELVNEMIKKNPKLIRKKK